MERNNKQSHWKLILLTILLNWLMYTWLLKVTINNEYQKIIKEEKMGFDINGLSPNPEPIGEDNEPIGTYFRNNVWWWRGLHGLISGVSEYVYREQNNIPQGHEDKEILPKKLKEIHEWRDIWTSCGFNDGTKIEGKWLQLVEDSLEYAIENKNEPEIISFVEYLQERLGEQYPFEWHNVEEFHAFLVNSGGFEVW